MKKLIPHIIQQQYEKQTYEGQLEAFTMFVDVSGFTTITQTLMSKGSEESAEILSDILNSLFEPIVNEVYAHKGFISIFAGDAFTAIFPKDKVSINSVTQCSLKIQAIFEAKSIQKTKLGSFAFGVKIGLSQGPVYWGIVGKQQKSFFLEVKVLILVHLPKIRQNLGILFYIKASYLFGMTL